MSQIHQKLMLVYNSAFDKLKFKSSTNKHQQPQSKFPPKLSFNYHQSQQKIDSKTKQKSIALQKQLDLISLQFYNPRKSQQLGFLINKNANMKNNQYIPSKSKGLKSNEFLVIPILGSSRLSPREIKRKQSKHYSSQIHRKSCSTLQRARTAKNDNEIRQKEGLRIKNKTQKKIIGKQYSLRKRDSLASNSSVKGGMTDTTQCTSSNNKKSDKNNFQNLIVQICKRNGYEENTKLFIIETEDKIVKKGFSGLEGWAENPNKRSLYFNIKWVGLGSPSIFKSMNTQQYVNHFRNLNKLINPVQRHNHLNKNLNLKQYYPESFNLESDYKDFLYQYQKTAILSLLNTHTKYINSRNIRLPIHKHKNIETQDILKSLLKSQKFYSEVSNNNFVLNIPIAIQMCIYLQNMKSAIENSMNPLYLSEQTIRKLVNFSHIAVPYDTLSKHQNQDQFPIIFSEDYNLFKTKNSFRTPSKHLLVLIRMYYDYFKNIKLNRNISNYWIIHSYQQPSIVTNKLDILTISRKQSIIQKYITSSNILNSLEQFKNKSFTVNYYILLAKNHLIKYYIYQHYYISTSKQSHQPNHYSFDEEDTKQYLKSEIFQNIFKKQYDIDYKLQIENKIHNFINRYLLYFQFQNERNKFQILNVKFVIDQSLHPFLVEIKRIQEFEDNVEWISDMYSRMVSDAVSILFDPLNQNHNRWRIIPDYSKPKYN